MRRLLTAALLCVLVLTAITQASAAGSTNSNYTACMMAIREQRAIQAQAHITANVLRSMGYDEDSRYLQLAQENWDDAKKNIQSYMRLAQYTDEDVRILATTVFYEAGCTTEEMRQYVAQVVLNRVADSRFPNTIYGVVTAPGQYAGNYVTAEATQAIKDKDAKNGTNYYNTCVNSAKKAMMGKVDMPSNVVFQANFTQGTGVWKAIYYNSGYFSSTSYYCYG